MILLPPYLVPYLDSLVLPDADPAEHLEELQAGLAHLKGWHRFQSTFFINKEEEGMLENMGVLLTDLDEALKLEGRQEQLTRLVPTMYAIVGLMESINQGRDRANFSPQPAVNDLLLAGASWVQGVAEDEAVLDRLARLIEYSKNLRHMLRASKPRLIPEVAESFEVGLKQLKNGIDHAQAAIESEYVDDMHDALAEISEGSGLMQSLLDWHRMDQERLAARHRRFRIPIIGPMAELYLDSAREFPKDQWERGLRGFYRDELPQLFTFWQVAEKKIYLPPEERAGLIEGVENALQSLRDALETMEDPEKTKEEGVEAYELALEELSAAFEAIQSRTLLGLHLKGSQVGDYFDLLAGAIDRYVPIVAFPEMIHSSPPPPEWAPFLDPARQYCEDGNTDHLYVAIHRLLSMFPAPAEEKLPQDWTCPYCQNLNPLGSKTCVACGRTPQLQSDESTWKA